MISYHTNMFTYTMDCNLFKIIKLMYWCAIIPSGASSKTYSYYI